MSGSEQILKKIKSGAIGVMFLGLTLMLLPIIIIVCMLFTGSASGNIVLIIILAAVAAGGTALMVYNMRIMLNPSSSFFLKKNPDVLRQADELLSDLIYRDKFIMFSHRIIASAADLRQISYTDEVFVIYVYIHKTNGVTDMKQLKLETARRTITINIYGKKDEEINELIGNILEHCRYAKVGYNPDSMNYLKQMRELWKKDQENKGEKV